MMTVVVKAVNDVDVSEFVCLIMLVCMHAGVFWVLQFVFV